MGGGEEEVVRGAWKRGHCNGRCRHSNTSRRGIEGGDRFVIGSPGFTSVYSV